MVAAAVATPALVPSSAWNMTTVIVIQGPLYRTTVELSSEATVTNVSTMPPTMPPKIRGTVTRRNVGNGATPRLIEASSRLWSIWYRMALEDFTANGSFRTT